MPFKPSEHQAAGHAGCLTDDENGLFVKITNQQEIDFYNSIYREDQEALTKGIEAPEGSKLVDWIPRFYGTLNDGDQLSAISGTSPTPLPNGKSYIVLENLYSGYSKPSIIDIKLGKVLTDDSADSEKQERLRKVSESTTSGSHHFRICGMKLYNKSLTDLPKELPHLHETIIVRQNDLNDDVYLEYDKFFGRKLNGDNVKDGIKLFLSNALPPELYAMMVEVYWKRLQLLYNCLLDHEVRIIAGSLLFILENDLARYPPNSKELEALNPLTKPAFTNDDESDDDDEDEAKEMNPLSSLNFIDLAHAKHVPGEGYDENVIIGVENLVKIFSELKTELE
ncbi:uncharacterized protein KQ657_000836 [Scheffersomyces spartinae]|uniref:Kinase n=1 Tax=Scheffersomyces spartinae TaxID=45513 RepID=A0A9P7V9P0_9ASCO|nr:uncharacterized protein KQ657_000836 [Scheffersomyces spartinae]KAG7193418.1 hypothetical protein KQ657_000836 [Scheffersomyces spartinae]